METKTITGARLAALVFLACNAAVASASVTEYTDQGTYDSATSTQHDYNFEGLAPSGGVSFGDASVGGVNFSGGAGSADYVIDRNAPYANYGSSFFAGQSDNPGIDPTEVVCTLAGSTAVGFTFGDYVDSDVPFTVTLNGTDTFTLNTPSYAGIFTGFVGFTSNSPITSVTFSSDGLDFDVTQFDLSSSKRGDVGVPEPGALVLLATGLLPMALLSRRRMLKVRRSK